MAFRPSPSRHLTHRLVLSRSAVRFRLTAEQDLFSLSLSLSLSLFLSFFLSFFLSLSLSCQHSLANNCWKHPGENKKVKTSPQRTKILEYKLPKEAFIAELKDGLKIAKGEAIPPMAIHRLGKPAINASQTSTIVFF